MLFSANLAVLIVDEVVAVDPNGRGAPNLLWFFVLITLLFEGRALTLFFILRETRFVANLRFQLRQDLWSLRHYLLRCLVLWLLIMWAVSMQAFHRLKSFTLRWELLPLNFSFGTRWLHLLVLLHQLAKSVCVKSKVTMNFPEKFMLVGFLCKLLKDASQLSKLTLDNCNLLGSSCSEWLPLLMLLQTC